MLLRSVPLLLVVCSVVARDIQSAAAPYSTNFSSSAEVLTEWSLSTGCEHCDKASRDECNQFWPNATAFGALPGGVGMVHTTQRIPASWSPCGANASSGHLVWNRGVTYGTFTTVARWFPGSSTAVASATGFIGLDSAGNAGSITLGFHGEGSPQTGTGKHGFQLGAYRQENRSHHQQIIPVPNVDLSATFNTFTVLWTPTSVTWSFNGAVVYVMDKADDVPNEELFMRLDSRAGWISLLPPGASYEAEFLSFAYEPLAVGAPAAASLQLGAPAAASLQLNATVIQHLGAVLATFDCGGKPSAGAFIAVYAPGDAPVSTIAAQPYPATPPWTAASPIKWVVLQSIPGVSESGVGSYVFTLGNPYESVVLHLFNGTLEQPRLLASSPVVTFVDAAAPLRGHIARTPLPSEMNVTWHAPARDATARVRWGSSPGSYAHEAPVAMVGSYARSDMAGPPASGMGWYPSHVWLTATITGLTPGDAAPVYYAYGSDENGFAAESSFTPPPAVGPDTPTRILLIADNGVTEPDGCQDHWDEPSASLTMERLREDVARGNVSLVLHPGDLSYATGLLVKWESYMTGLAGVADRVPYMTGQGNHERDYPSTGAAQRFNASTDSGGEAGIATNTRFPGSLGWWALEHGPVHVLMLNSELEVDVASPQYAFAASALRAVDRARTPWSIVAYHRPTYWVDASSKTGGGYDGSFGAMDPLFMETQVDAVIVGHVHNGA